MKQTFRLFLALCLITVSAAASAWRVSPGDDFGQIKPYQPGQGSQRQQVSEQQMQYHVLQRKAAQVVFEPGDPKAIFDARKQLADYIIANPALFSENNPIGISAQTGYFSSPMRHPFALSSEVVREKMQERCEQIAARVDARRNASEEWFASKRRIMEERRSRLARQ